jgi:hypothetical protein
MRSPFLISLLLAGFAMAAGAAKASCPALPYTITNGQVADATHVMADLNSANDCANGIAPGGSANALQYNGGGGLFGSVGPLSNGQIPVGVTGSAPVATSITAGAGIIVASGPGSISISATSSGGGGAGAQREFGPFAPPDASIFTVIDGPGGITPTITNIADVGLVYSVPITSDPTYFPGVYRAVPTSTSWTLTVRAKYSTLIGNYPEFGVWLKDSSGQMLGEIVEYDGGPNLVIKRNNSNASYGSNPYVHALNEVPTWFRVSYDGTNIKFYVSWDGQNWLYAWTETNTTFLNGTLQLVGVGGTSAITDTSFWKPGSMTGGVITYWNIQ